uniref:Calcium uptake protein 1 n=1 Tax=Ascaris suum TaxID=6253 RepID=F1L358_ASCSU
MLRIARPPSIRYVRTSLSSVKSIRHYERGGGIRLAEDVEKEHADNVAKQRAEENPFEYTIFGNKRKKKEDLFHYTDRKAGRGYSDYANTIYPHRPYIWQPLRKLYWWNYMAVLIALILLMIDFDGLWQYGKHLSSKFRPEAATIESRSADKDENISSDSDSDSTSEDQKKKKKKRIGFRERRIIEYENRIRMYSAPDKIFRYFATLKVPNDDGSARPYDIYMTPEDFVRSITPGVMQPRNLGLDQFKLYDPEKHKHKFADQETVFAKLGEHGLISFSDYLFLMTLLSTSPNDFKLAFRIFDVNGDGKIDKKEFERVQELVMAQTTVALRHRDHAAVGLFAKKQMNSTLSSFFFGKDGTNELAVEDFLLFQAHLHRDILKIECERRDVESPPKGVISEISFADLLLMYSCLGEQKQRKLLKRVKKRYGPNSPERTGITLKEVFAFFCFLYYIDDVDLALHFYHLAGVSIDSDALKMVAKRVTGSEISDHVVDVVITLFDDNKDGQLSNKEFVSIMKKRMKRGLERPRDTGLLRLFEALGKCTVSQAHYAMYAALRSH